jgi:hypothetical protein
MDMSKIYVSCGDSVLKENYRVMGNTGNSQAACPFYNQLTVCHKTLNYVNKQEGKIPCWLTSCKQGLRTHFIYVD